MTRREKKLIFTKDKSIARKTTVTDPVFRVSISPFPERNFLSNRSLFEAEQRHERYGCGILKSRYVNRAKWLFKSRRWYHAGVTELYRVGARFIGNRSACCHCSGVPRHCCARQSPGSRGRSKRTTWIDRRPAGSVCPGID